MKNKQTDFLKAYSPYISGIRNPNSEIASYVSHLIMQRAWKPFAECLSKEAENEQKQEELNQLFERLVLAVLN